MKFNELRNLSDSQISSLRIEIPPLRKGNLASEYNSLITDYSTKEVAVTNRKIKPYLSSETHGSNCYDRLLHHFKDIPKGTVLDMGCGAGELLHHIKSKAMFDKQNLYGISIHTGEVLYARNKFSLPNVVPGDMREARNIFTGMKFDTIIFHCVFQFIEVIERLQVMIDCLALLNPNGKILVVNYKDQEDASVDASQLSEFFNHRKVEAATFQSMGALYEYTAKI